MTYRNQKYSLAMEALEVLIIPAIFIGIFLCLVAEIIAMGIYLLTGWDFHS